MPLLIVLLPLAIISSTLTVPVAPVEDPKSIWIDALAQCESSASSTIRVMDSNHKWSYGLLQFQGATWLNYKKLGTTPENIYDAELQRTVARHILDNGGEGNWYICNKRVSKSLGSYPTE